MSSTFIERDAVRMLFILFYCGKERSQLFLFDNNDYTHSIDSESKLQKIDFWLRYPDHFAAALLYGCETGDLTKDADEIKQIIRIMYHTQEPAIRWTSMRKYLRGAYEPLDEVMALLSSLNLAYKRILSWGHCSYYFLTTKGYNTVERMLQECSETGWYAERCQLINRFFGTLNGYEIRKLQYLQEDYSATPYKETIGRIEFEIQRRFLHFYGEPL